MSAEKRGEKIKETFFNMPFLLLLIFKSYTLIFKSLIFSDYKMRRVRNLTIITSCFFALMLLLAVNLEAEVIRITGEMETNLTAYITKRLSSYQRMKNLKYRLYLPETFTDTINGQNISKIKKAFIPYPTDLNEFTDEYGNQGIDLVWNKDVRIVQLDIQFNAKTYAHFTDVNSESSFPVAVDDQYQIHLTSTDLAPATDMYINYIGRNLSKGMFRQIDVVNSVLLWIDRTIRLSNATEIHDAPMVLKNREGSNAGVCNLTVAMFKGLGIPSRVVYGSSFQKEMLIKADQQSIIYDQPNNERYWVEVFFSDIGWVNYDPHGMHFGTTSHVIKFAVGPDSDYPSDQFSVEEGDFDLQKEYIYDIRSDYSKLNFVGYDSTTLNKMVIRPNMQEVSEYELEPELDIEGLSIDETKEHVMPENTGIIISNNNTSRSLDVVATLNNVYAQRFTLSYPLKLTEVKLPLIKFGDEGNIWVDIFHDNNGVPGERVFRTLRIDSTRIRYMMVEDPWLTFPMSNKIDSHLPEGSYWIALRSSGDCIFNWYACEGDVTGEGNDTRMMDVSLQKRQWNTLLNFDMNFQIIGRLVAEEQTS
jgi:hypothetical protein